MRNIKKVKKKIIIICSMLLGIITIMPFRLVNAEQMTWEYNFYHVSNSIRATCSGYRETDPNYYVYNDPTNKKYRMVIEVDFGSDAVTGSFTLGLAQIARGDVILCQGCTMTSNLSSTSVSFSVSGVNYCKIEVYSSSYERGLTSFTGSWSRYQSQELNSINDIKGYVDGVETSLTNIYNSIHAIEGYVDSVESLLTTLNNTVSTSNSLLDTINNNTILNSRPSYSTNAWIWAYHTYTNNEPYIFMYYGMPAFIYESNQNSGQYILDRRIMIPSSSTVDFYMYSNANPFNSIVLYNDTSNLSPVTMEIERIYFDESYPIYRFIIHLSNSSNRYANCSIEFNTRTSIWPIYLGINNLVPDEVRLMFGLEYYNTYTRKLDLINNSVNSLSQYIDGVEGYIDNVESLLTDIKNGISDISYVNDNTQTIIDNNVNNYNSYTTDIHNIENNYINQFNTYQQNITTPSLPAAITNSITSYKSFIDGFFTGVPYVKTILSVILFCFLIICLLGV